MVFINKFVSWACCVLQCCFFRIETSFVLEKLCMLLVLRNVGMSGLLAALAIVIMLKFLNTFCFQYGAEMHLNLVFIYVDFEC